jgi:hypothetical protein
MFRVRFTLGAKSGIIGARSREKRNREGEDETQARSTESGADGADGRRD